jgi:hypothetical protein
VGGYAHTLAVDRVEAADRVTERKQATREFHESVEMSAETGGKPKANNLAKLLRFLDGVVNGGSTQPLRVSEKPVATARRLFAVAPHEGHNPSVVLQRKHDRGETSLGGRVKRGHGFPVGRSIVGDGEDGGGICDFYPDGGFFGARSADGFEDAIDEIAAPRGVND